MNVSNTVPTDLTKFTSKALLDLLAKDEQINAIQGERSCLTKFTSKALLEILKKDATSGNKRT